MVAEHFKRFTMPILAGMLVTCAGPNELSADKAALVLGSSEQFATRSASALFIEQLKLSAAGMTAVDEALVEMGLAQKVDVPKRGVFIQLTPKGLQAAKAGAWVEDPNRMDYMSRLGMAAVASMGGTPDPYLGDRSWNIPMATARVDKVNAVKKSENLAEVSFRYDWVPNEIGQKILELAPSDDKQYGQKNWGQDNDGGEAELRLTEDGWRVESLSLGTYEDFAAGRQ
ncbi:hypothetical protein [Gloeobacter violaceus]|nr:hypothetical protein [Gloeobacter violaceus]